jgi:hypothetical protein
MNESMVFFVSNYFEKKVSQLFLNNRALGNLKKAACLSAY